MSESKRLEYEGPMSVGFQIEEWGVVYVGDDQEPLANRIMAMLGQLESDYEWDEIGIANVRISIEVLDDTITKESELIRARLAAGGRPSDPDLIDFDPPPAPETT